MLRELHIKNFSIIDDVNIAFEAGFNVLTGETGAGKSIIIDALCLALGQRATACRELAPRLFIAIRLTISRLLFRSSVSSVYL